MPSFIMQAKSADADGLIATIESMGVTVRNRLANLEAISGSAVLIIDAPDGMTEHDLHHLPGVTVLEGRFMHPFWDPANSIFDQPIFPPNELAAVALQLLPPFLYTALPDQRILTALLGTTMADVGAGKPRSREEAPLGSPNLVLGSVVSGDTPGVTGDLDEIMALIRVPDGANLGQDAVVAIIDSGVDPVWVAPEDRLDGWSGDGTDPWSDQFGHGSMCAGIIKAIAPGAKIISVKPAVDPVLGNIDSLGTMTALDFVAGKALEIGVPIISNQSWGIFGAKNLNAPCSVAITRTVRMLSEENLVLTSWAVGNNREEVGRNRISAYCVTGDTLVMSAHRGVVPIRDVKEGDCVWTSEGKGIVCQDEVRHRDNLLDMRLAPKRVERVLDMGQQETFELKTRSRSVTATADQKFMALSHPERGNWQTEWKTLSSLAVGDYVLTLKNLPDAERKPMRLPDNPFGLRFTDDNFMRFTGFMVGDGSVNEKGQIGVCLPKGDLHSYYRGLTDLLFGKELNGPAHQERFFSKTAANLLIGLLPKEPERAEGRTGKRAYYESGKRVPEWVWALPNHQIMAFIQGYLDADGSKIKRNKTWYNIGSPNDLLVRELHELALSVGYQVSNISSIKRNTAIAGYEYDDRPLHQFQIYTESPRNNGKARQWGIPRGVAIHPQFRCERIRSITRKGVAQVFDLTIEDNPNFIGNGFLLFDCMNTTKYGLASGALQRNLNVQPYSSVGAQCSPLQPSAMCPTFGKLPWGNAWMDFGDQGGGTSSAAPQTSGTLALMMTAHPGKSMAEYRAAIRMSSANGPLGFPMLPFTPLTGWGMLQVDRAIGAVPRARWTPAAVYERLLSTSISRLGQEPPAFIGRFDPDRWTHGHPL